jgi:hypothetical protein
VVIIVSVARRLFAIRTCESGSMLAEVCAGSI